MFAGVWAVIGMTEAVLVEQLRCASFLHPVVIAYQLDPEQMRAQLMETVLADLGRKPAR